MAPHAQTQVSDPARSEGVAEKAPRVLIADWHALFRIGVRAELEVAGYDICAEAGSCAEAILAALRHEPDVCLFDVDLPTEGLRTARAIARRLPQTKMVLLGETAATLDIGSMLRGGVVGYVEKDIDPPRLPQVVAAVLAGEPVVPRRHLRSLLDQAGFAA